MRELREIAPPVLLVNKKHLRFGEVPRERLAPPLSVSFYNAGGGKISGEIKARAPWIVISQNRYSGNENEVTVRVDPARTTERGTLLTGRLEINSDDQRDAQGEVVAGDKWSVECSVSFAPAPGQLQVNGRDAAPAPLGLTARRGQAASGEFTLQNTGESPLEFQIASLAEGATGGIGRPIEGLIFLPSEGTLMPGQSVAVQVSVPSADLPAGTYPSGVAVRSPGRTPLVVPLTLHIQSPLEFLKTRLTGR